VLSSDPSDPTFAPEPYRPLDQRSLYQNGRTLLARTFALASKMRDDPDLFPEGKRGRLDALLERENDLDRRLYRVTETRIEAMRIRTHGDLRLQQVLFTGDDFVFIDFEGDPARPLRERRFKRPAFRDVACMMRSFHHAAEAALRTGRLRPEDAVALAPWARAWHTQMAAHFYAVYLEAAQGAAFVPERPEHAERLFDYSIIENCLLELGRGLRGDATLLEAALAGLEGVVRWLDLTSASARLTP
jgi:maltose alpha-D-glucosyltransferase/alpha-amylase